jgi:hypothetical protein
MTPEQEAELIEKMAEEIFLDEQAKSSAQANFALFGTICGITWEQANSTEYNPLFANKARNAARAALSIAKPIICDEAIREHLEVVDELPAVFDEWWKANAETVKSATLTSLLYDINLLPEQVATFKSIKMMRYLVAVVEHFKMARDEALKSKGQKP